MVGLEVGLIVFGIVGELVVTAVGDVVVGLAEGALVGRLEGAVGLIDGRKVGRDGLKDGRTEGLVEGPFVILIVGALVGALVGGTVGNEVGRKVLVGSLRIKLGTMVTTPKAAATPATMLIGPEPTEGSFNLAVYVCESIPRNVGTVFMIDAATRLTLVRQLLPFKNVAAPLASIKTSRENGPIVTSKTSPET